MLSSYQLKPAFQGLLRPLTRWLAAQGISANQVTLFAILLSITAGAALALFPASPWPLLALPLVLLLRMALNAIDGLLAHEHNMKTALGAMLNELGDVISDTALYLPFALIAGVSAPLVVSVVVLMLLAEMAGVIVLQVSSQRRYDGPMGKSDRAIFFSILALLLGLGVMPGIWLDSALVIAQVLLLLTIYNRVKNALV